jgi:hypothetical protein
VDSRPLGRTARLRDVARRHQVSVSGAALALDLSEDDRSEIGAIFSPWYSSNGSD